MLNEETIKHFSRMENLEMVISKEEIEKKINEMALTLKKDYGDKDPILIGVLNGSFMFMADLIRKLDWDCEVGFKKI